MKNTAEKIMNVGAYEYYIEHEAEETGAFSMHLLEDLMYYGDVDIEVFFENDKIKPEMICLILAYMKLFIRAKEDMDYWNFLNELMVDDTFTQLIQGQIRAYSHPLMCLRLSHDFEYMNEAVEELSEIIASNFWVASDGMLEDDHFDRLIEFADDFIEALNNDTPSKIWEMYGYDTYEYFAEFGILWESCRRIIYTT